MTYKEIYYEFLDKFPKAQVEDYRPAYGMYIDGVDDCIKIPNAIIVWLKDGSKLIYIHNSK